MFVGILIGIAIMLTLVYAFGYWIGLDGGLWTYFHR